MKHLHRSTDSGAGAARRERGFSLLELLIVIAILGLVVALVTPSMMRIIRRGRLQNAASQFGTSLLRARLQAVKRGNNVGLCVTNDTGNPNYGEMILFVDTNSDGSYDAGDTVLQGIPMPADSGSKFLQVLIDTPNNNSPSTGSATFSFVFTPFGSAINANSSGQVSEAVYVKDDRGNLLQVSVPVAGSGKVTTTKYNPTPTAPAVAGYFAPPWNWS